MRPLLAALLLAACSAEPPASRQPLAPPTAAPASSGPPTTPAADSTSAPASSASAASPASSGSPAASASASAAASSAAPSGPCPAGMVETGKVCMDRFEAPNQQGEKPLVMVSAPEAEAWCAERGKRLCSEDEWIRSCGGPKGQLFPYGTSYKEGTCNDDGQWKNPSWVKLGKWPSDEARAEVTRLDQRDPSGQRAGCVSPEGARDMTGNVAEWVRRTRKHESDYPHVSMGCFWGKCFRPPHTPTCDYANYKHPSGWRSYEIGFRCCQERRAP